MMVEEVAVVKDLGLVSDLNSTEAGFDNCFEGAPFENFFTWVAFTESPLDRFFTGELFTSTDKLEVFFRGAPFDNLLTEMLFTGAATDNFATESLFTRVPFGNFSPGLISLGTA